MEQDDLNKSLDRLRAEIAKLGEDDEPVKRRMKRLVADLERKIEEATDEDEALLESLSGYIEQFEVEHPRLTGALNRILVSLSNIGI